MGRVPRLRPSTRPAARTAGHPDDAGLAGAIRTGTQRGGASEGTLWAVLEADVRDRLLVANPRYLQRPRPAA